MTDVDTLLRRYIERYRSGGEVDPSDLLAQASGGDRARLAALIEGYLEAEAPAQGWNPDAFEGSLAERAVARLAEEWSGASGQLPSLLVSLREKAKIKRGDLVARLADALGVSAKREKVALYYHRLEHGLLPAQGVSTAVFEALAGVLGTSAEELRRAGESVRPAAGRASAEAIYARTAEPSEEYAAADELRAPSAAPRSEGEEPDEVDRLFTGCG